MPNIRPFSLAARNKNKKVTLGLTLSIRHKGHFQYLPEFRDRGVRGVLTVLYMSFQVPKWRKTKDRGRSVQGL